MHAGTEEIRTRRKGEKTMKREGWQHGAVRVNRNKLLRIADGEAATAAELLGGGAVAYARAPSKPTNASRSTGKCRRPPCTGCHDHPATKARDKAKGAHKLHACDVALNHRLVSWRVVDGAGACAGIPDYRGASASAVLAYLAGGNSWYEDEDDDGDSGDLETAPPAKGGLSDLYDLIVGLKADAAAPAGQEDAPVHPNNIAVGDTDASEEQEQGTDGEDEEGDMGFCMVGITIALEFSDGEEDWIVVEEIPST